MKFVENFPDKHAGEKIWIVGSGPSLDDLPDDFFSEKKNRISIALNWSIIGFPQCTYWLAGHPEISIYMKNTKPEVLKKSILLLPLVPSRKGTQLNDKGSLKLLGPYRNDPIYLRWERILGNRKLFRTLLNSTVESIMNRQPCRYIALRTIAHYAIQIAVVFGAKEISLVGCEAATQGKKHHAAKRKIGECYKKRRRAAFLDDFRLGTRLLAEAFKPHGIEIRRYYYGKGYENI